MAIIGFDGSARTRCTSHSPMTCGVVLGDRCEIEGQLSGQYRSSALERVHCLDRETGALAAFTAVMAVALFALIGLVVDGGSAIAAQRAASDEALQAARAGAAQLSVSALRSGQLVLNAPAAIDAAESYTRSVGVPGTASVDGSTVVVQIRTASTTVILGMIGIRSISVTATAGATDVAGVVSAD